MNIKYGTWYLSELQTEFEGNEVLALAAIMQVEEMYMNGWKNIIGV